MRVSSKSLAQRVGYYLSLLVFIEIHDSKTHLVSTLDNANEIHDPIKIFIPSLTRVAIHKELQKCLGLDSSLACLLLLNFWPHIPAPLPTIRFLVPNLLEISMDRPFKLNEHRHTL